MAFRYHFPEQQRLDRILISQENTTFYLSASAKTWPLILPSYNSHYEENYQSLESDRIPDGSIIGLPFLMEQQGIWMAVTEADLTDYAGLYLTPSRQYAHAFESRLNPGLNDRFKVEGITPFTSPWRVILLGDTPGALIESNWITALNLSLIHI